MANDTAKNYGVFTDGAEAKGYASDVNFAAGELLLTNKTGAAKATGWAGVLDHATSRGFVAGSPNDLRPIVVIPQTISGDNVATTKSIADEEIGWCFVGPGYVPAVAVDGAVAVNEYLAYSSTAGKLTGTGTVVGDSTARPVTACAIALSAAAGADDVEALLLGVAQVEPTWVVLHSEVGTFDLTATSTWQTMDSFSIPQDTLTDGVGVSILFAVAWYGTQTASTNNFRFLLGSTASFAASVNASGLWGGVARAVGLGGLSAQRFMIEGHFTNAQTGSYYLSAIGTGGNGWVGFTDMAEDNSAGALTLAMQGFSSGFSGSSQGFKYTWQVLGYG